MTTTPTPEPVAWMQRWKTLASCPETVQLGLHEPAPRKGVTVTPLYARPPEMEALVEALERIKVLSWEDQWANIALGTIREVARAALAQMGEG